MFTRNPLVRGAVLLVILFAVALVLVSRIGERRQAARHDRELARYRAALKAIPPGIEASSLPEIPAGLALPRPAPAVGPGIVVFEPVAGSPDPDVAAFGAGCSRWLTFTVGGLAQFGRQGALISAQRVATEWARSDLRLTPEDALKAGRMLGATHVAAGTVGGSPTACTLTYTVFDCATGAQVGSPLTVAGSMPQIAARLPSTARRLAACLSVQAPPERAGDAPASADLAELGRFPWQIRTRIPFSDLRGLEAVAARMPAAALGIMDAVRWQDPDRLLSIAQSAAGRAPGNVLVLAEVARQTGARVPGVKARVTTMAKSFPNSYLLVRSELRVRGRVTAEDVLAATAHAVSLCPSNPDAWMAYSDAVENAAQSVRKGKFYADMSRSEEAYVSRMYPLSIAAAIRGLKVDPLYGQLWLRLARAAQFGSDDRLADGAYWTAVRLLRDEPDLYWWGLQMYQAKWQGGANKLRIVARCASREVFQSPRSASHMADVLRETRHFGDAQIQSQRAIDGYGAIIRESPDLLWPRLERAAVLKGLGQMTNAEKGYREACARFPKSVAAHEALGFCLTQRGDNAGAEQEYRAAIRINPKSITSHGNLGQVLVVQKKWKEGEAELRWTLQADPSWAVGHADLGWALQMQHRLSEAANEYTAALRLQPTSGDTWDRLTRTLNEAGRYEEAVMAGERGVPYTRGRPYARASLAEAYLGAGRWRESASLFQEYLSQIPSDPGAHMLYARALYRLGRTVEADAECRECIRLKPNSPAAGKARELLRTHGRAVIARA